MITDPRYLSAETDRLEENDLKFSPYRGWQISTVTFHTSADTDTDVPHTLTTADPEGVQYQVLQSSSPMVVYHDLSSTRVAWQQGLIRLRSTCASGTAVVLLTVTDAAVKSNPAPANTSFSMPIAKQVTDLFGDTRAYIGSVGSVTWLDSFVGPGFGVNSQASGATTYNWQMGLRRNGGIDQGLFFADAVGGKVVLFLHQFNGNYYVMPGPNSGPIDLGGNIAPTWRWNNVYAVTADVSAVKFPATQVASADPNTLDDYEEGTFTPVLNIGGVAVGAYGSFYGRYTKIGNQVEIEYNMVVSSKGGLVGALTITGLPFTANAVATGTVDIATGALLLTSSPYGAVAGGTTIFLLIIDGASNRVQLTDANIANNNTIQGSLTYRI